MQVTRTLSRRFAASVTGFGRKYRRDVFVRTRVTILVLHLGYALIILVAAVYTLNTLYNETLHGMVTAVGTALTATSTIPINSETLLAPIEATRGKNVEDLALVVLIVTTLFGYLVAKIALLPTQRALNAQKEFIGNIAHELRTPLSTIKTNTEVRLLDDDVPPDVRALYEENLEELDRISSIIDNLLSLNALMRPEHIRFEHVDVAQLAGRVALKLRDLARSKGVTLSISTGKGRTAWGSTSAIEQILTNLVHNALRHTDGGAITVAVEQMHGQFLTIRVSDSGTGISRKDLARIFDPFYRGSRARTRHGGEKSGLGLAIVSEIVKLHQGRISIQSTLGHGTTVTVVLPSGPDELIEEAPPLDERSAGEPGVTLDFSRDTGYDRRTS